MTRKEVLSGESVVEGRESVPDDRLIALWQKLNYGSHIAGEVANRNLFTHAFRHSGYSIEGKKVSISFGYKRPGVIYRLLDTYGYKYTLKPGVVLDARQTAAFYQGVAGISIIEQVDELSERRLDLAVRRDGQIIESAVAESTHGLSTQGVGLVTSLWQENDYYRDLLDGDCEGRIDAQTHAFVARRGITLSEIEPAERYLGAIVGYLQGLRRGPQPFFPVSPSVK